ncbi:MAG: YbaK/EbsC family protein [Ruthenibacterium sp.]
MSVETVKNYLKQWNLDTRVQEFDVSSATVELAAEALHCEGARIAKTLSFALGDAAILIVTAGDAKIDNTKYKAQFGTKAKMLSFDEVLPKTGHAVGGVCPFAILPDVAVYLDASLRRFKTVYPACGSANSAIELTLAELETCAPGAQWVDVCKGWNDCAE